MGAAVMGKRYNAGAPPQIKKPWIAVHRETAMAVVRDLFNRNRPEGSPDTTDVGHSDGLPNAYGRSWYILLVAWAAYLIDLFMRYNIPTVIPILRREHDWSAATIGWIDSSFLIAYALGQLPWGVVSQRWLGARWTVTIGTALIAFASIAFAIHVDSIALAIVARALIGLGAAAVWVPVNPMLARWFAPGRRGTQTGILAMGGALGTGTGGAVMPLLITGSVSVFGLSAIQSGFLYSAIPGLIMSALVPLVLRHKPEEVGLVSLDRSKPVVDQIVPIQKNSGESFRENNDELARSTRTRHYVLRIHRLQVFFLDLVRGFPRGNLSNQNRQRGVALGVRRGSAGSIMPTTRGARL